MTGTNHMITGALIGATVSIPIVAVPLAFASHFALDSIPHFADDSLEWNSKKYNYVLSVDTVLGVSLLLSILIIRPTHWPLLLLCAIAAWTPDLMWLPKYVRTLRGTPHKQYNRIMRFHKKLQREFEWGLVFEAAWFIFTLPFFILVLVR